MLSLSQQQRLQQKLSPQQIQYIKLLQLPQIQLEQAIQAELEVNPALEEGVDEDLDTELLDLKPENENEQIEKPELPEKSEFSDSIPDETYTQKTSSDEFSWEDYINKDDLYGFKSEEYAQHGDDDDDRPDSTPRYQSNLGEKILEELRLQPISDLEYQIGEHLIGSTDADGYLRIETHKILDDIYFNLGITVPEVQLERVRKIIMNIEPVGYCSVTLQECLLAQLENMELTETSENAIQILTECFDEFTRKHFDQIMKKLDLYQDELKDAFELIQKLNPKPGDGDFSPNENYVTPDFFVIHENDGFTIQLNDKGTPPLRINKKYVEMAASKSSGLNDDARNFIRKKVEDAKWFRQSIMQRRETMMKVMTSIVEIQQTFFETGTGLRPMILKSVADKIMMDISTISRVVNSKYVQTEYGVYSLKHFFSEGIETDSGEDASSKEVKEQIKLILDAEDGSKPLSDDKIADLLNSKGFNIARRTVTKYRESLNIPVARLRKKIN